MSHDGKQADEEKLQWCMNVHFLVWRKVWQVEYLSKQELSQNLLTGEDKLFLVLLTTDKPWATRRYIIMNLDLQVLLFSFLKTDVLILQSIIFFLCFSDRAS